MGSLMYLNDCSELILIYECPHSMKRTAPRAGEEKTNGSKKNVLRVNYHT